MLFFFFMPNGRPASGFQKCEIKNITGHASEKGLDPYDSGDDSDDSDNSELMMMSLAMNPKSSSNSNVHNINRSKNEFQRCADKQPMDISRLVHRADFIPNFKFGINFAESGGDQSQWKPSRPFSSSSVGPVPAVYNNCTFNINTVAQPPQKRRRIRIIESSDSECSQENVC